ncbi:cysteine--tRNA ligase [Candidatus Roizmanbacteria bacterium RIFCSPHIGHO2_12_FULL_39_8]|uniref:Cysteine--tRNA ligase n=1 Tax=Candidatus Roizmanbacteria bacterium RIFCSPHIGHO2_12_FULL_39_8 TaxID=1802050 RepID=A0A1F7HZS9_9BACT|nr:MAG: cysteine--tRNA ligase [Candidatus Roizmanbacteria bacterium RIFCSPHIGHO2_12_FULL_39_8]
MLQLRIFNTHSRKIENFAPLHPNKIKMYVCGVTPYDTSHLGHAFVFIFFDVVKRFFTHIGYKVTYVQNVTNIDDPLIERAKELHTTWEKLADKWIRYLLHDFKFLNIAMPDFFIYATDELEMMKKIITTLIEKKHAYIQEGNIYFSVDTFSHYGELSKLSRKEMLVLSAERGNDIKDPNKKNPLDFLLWKKSKKGEPSWSSPWNNGRPGWHIECTAMSMKYLGKQIDIHGGGNDLIFPHHESETAQAESYSGVSPFVKTWMHCGMVSCGGEKMSKSLGNLVYVQDLAKDHSPNTIRHYLLRHHYRKDWNHSEKGLQDSAQKMHSIEIAVRGIHTVSELHTHSIDLFSDDFDIPSVLEEMYRTKDVVEKKLLFDVLGFC